MNPRKVLILSPLFYVNAPQPSRIRELVRYWDTHFDITVLAFDSGDKELHSGGGTKVSAMQFTAAGRVLVGSRLKGNGSTGGDDRASKRDTGTKLRSLIKRVRINRLFFPDIFIVEYFNIKKRLVELAREVQPGTLIISVAPFTLMLLAVPVRKRFPGMKIVVDTGDPFHGDSSGYSKRIMHRLFARAIEKRCLSATDMLVVPTVILRKHYLDCYGDVITGDRVSVVENGINELFSMIPDRRAEFTAPFRMVYAGRFYKKMRDPSELYRAVMQFSEKEVILKVFGNIQDKYRPPASDPRFLSGGAVSPETLAGEYAWSDLIIYLDNAYGVQVPGKVYEVLAVNRPVLYIYRDAASPSFELVRDLDGVVMVQNNFSDIAAGIASVMTGRLKNKYSRGSESYRFDSLASGYMALLESLNTAR